MRTKASILFICTLIYTAELLALPATMCVKTVTTCCVSKKKSTEHGNCPMMAKKKAKEKEPCSEGKDCVNCPLCYSVTVPSITTLEKNSLVVPKNYPEYKPWYYFQYGASAWKPPNS